MEGHHAEARWGGIKALICDGVRRNEENLDLKKWWPWYQRIRRTFHYSLAADRRATRLLSQLIGQKVLAPIALKQKIKGRPVLILGAGPSLERDLRNMVAQPVLKRFAVIAADGATTALLEIAKTSPDIVVTDLDGPWQSLLQASLRGAATVVHGHGDNIPQLKTLVPGLLPVHGTTQAEPTSNVHNYGGFTDGDRAVYLAEAYGAKRIVLAGMDFGQVVGKYSKPTARSSVTKLGKLRMAQELLEYLAANSKVELYNLTSRGAEIKGFPRVRPHQLPTLG